MVGSLSSQARPRASRALSKNVRKYTLVPSATQRHGPQYRTYPASSGDCRYVALSSTEGFQTISPYPLQQIIHEANNEERFPFSALQLFRRIINRSRAEVAHW